MSQTVPQIDGYTVGKTYKTVTNASLGAWMMYVCAAFVAFIQITLVVQDHSKVAHMGTGIGMLVVFLVLAGILTFTHSQSPQRKYTVVRTFANGDGTLASEVRYLDGSTKINQHGDGNDDGFWKQLGGLMKETFTGK